MSIPTLSRRSRPAEPRRRRLLGALAAAPLWLLAGAGPAWALDLEQAKAAGLVGEMPDGYLGVVRNQQGAAQLAQRINAERREQYRQVAARIGAPLAAVERQAGDRLIQRAPAGVYVMTPNGRWVRK